MWEFGNADGRESDSTKDSPCLAASGKTAVEICRHELNQNPENMDIRFALSNALIRSKRFSEAIDILEQGLALYPDSRKLKKELSLAKSDHEESLWITKQQKETSTIQTENDKPGLDENTKLNIKRCKKSEGSYALAACNEALKVLPGDPSLSRRKGEVLLEMNRTGEAILSLRKSLQLDPSHRETSRKLNIAQSKRRVNAAKCQQSDGVEALEACNTALMAGAPDESDLQRRRGELLRDMNRIPEAVEAFTAALNLNPADTEITQILSALPTSDMVQGKAAKTDDLLKRQAITRSPETFTDQEGLEASPLEKEDFGIYHALVIGNTKYEFIGNLKTAINDAEAIAKILEKKYNFKVMLLKNATESKIIGALTKFRRDLTISDNFLIYYAGHGIMDEVTRRGYWLPIDSEKDNSANWISNQDITNQLKAMMSKHILVIVDSCYSGTLTRNALVGRSRTGGVEEWIKRMAQKRSRTVLTSGGLEPVVDFDGASNSVFARAFLKTLRENNRIIDMDSLFNSVRRRVVMNARQTPSYSDIRFANHEEGDFIFVPKN